MKFVGEKCIEYPEKTLRTSSSSNLSRDVFEFAHVGKFRGAPGGVF